MRVLVTGGMGFIGYHLCGALLGRGEEVVCVDNLITGNRAHPEWALSPGGEWGARWSETARSAGCAKRCTT